MLFSSTGAQARMMQIQAAAAISTQITNRMGFEAKPKHWTNATEKKGGPNLVWALQESNHTVVRTFFEQDILRTFKSDVALLDTLTSKFATDERHWTMCIRTLRHSAN